MSEAIQFFETRANAAAHDGSTAAALATDGRAQRDHTFVDGA